MYSKTRKHRVPPLLECRKPSKSRGGQPEPREMVEGNSQVSVFTTKKRCVVAYGPFGGGGCPTERSHTLDILEGLLCSCSKESAAATTAKGLFLMSLRALTKINALRLLHLLGFRIRSDREKSLEFCIIIFDDVKSELTVSSMMLHAKTLRRIARTLNWIFCLTLILMGRTSITKGKPESLQTRPSRRRVWETVAKASTRQQTERPAQIHQRFRETGEAVNLSHPIHIHLLHNALHCQTQRRHWLSWCWRWWSLSLCLSQWCPCG